MTVRRCDVISRTVTSGGGVRQVWVNQQTLVGLRQMVKGSSRTKDKMSVFSTESGAESLNADTSY